MSTSTWELADGDKISDRLIAMKLLGGGSAYEAYLASAEIILRECEALLITALGTRDQNEMRFQVAQKWEQLRVKDLEPGGPGLRADPEGFTDRFRRELALEHAHRR